MRLRFDGETRTQILDSELGWRTKGNLDFVRERPIFGQVHFTTDENGFRSWGDLDAQVRVLVLGDSFTKAAEVSDGSTYYDVLDRVEGVSVFAYGTGGYGSAQEYLILDEWVDSIQPHVVVWQFTGNDLINNSWVLESGDPLSNRMARPYYEEGEFVVRFPSRSWWVRHSIAARWLASRLGLFRNEALDQTPIILRLDEMEAYPQAVEATDAIMALVRARTGQIPIAAFSAEHFDWLGDTFAQISDRNGIRWVPGIIEALDESMRQGVAVDGRPRDAHWNANGHRIAGEILRDTLTAWGWLPGGAAPGEPAEGEAAGSRPEGEPGTTPDSP